MDLQTFIQQWKASHGGLATFMGRIVDQRFYRDAAAAGLLQPAQDGKGVVTIDGKTYGEINLQGQPTGQNSTAGNITSDISKAGLIGLGGYVAAPAVAGALGGGSPAAGASSIVDPGIGAAGVPNALAAGTGPAVSTGAAAGHGALWSTLIGQGTQLAGTAINAYQQGKATDAQTAAAQAALDFAKQQYQQQRTDLAPYRAAGQGAIGQLGYGLGIHGFESGPTAGTTVAAGPNGAVPLSAEGANITGLNPSAPGTPWTPTNADPTLSAAIRTQQQGNTGGAGPSQAPRVGEVRTINGQQGQWDGHGWTLVQNGAA